MKTAAITIQLAGVPAVHDVLDDIRETLCAASSEGWDSFSEETRQEIGDAIDACDALMRVGVS